MLGINALDSKYDDYLLEYAPRRGVAVYQSEFVDFLKMQFDEMLVIGKNFTRVFNTESDHSARAFGPRGVAGDAGRILHLAQRCIGVYEDLLLWAERLRGTSVPGKYRDLVSILSRFAAQPIEAIRGFVADYAQRVSEIPQHLADASHGPLVIEHEVKWIIPDELMVEYNRESERIKRLK
jgi:hypothetical protein